MKKEEENSKKKKEKKERKKLKQKLHPKHVIISRQKCERCNTSRVFVNCVQLTLKNIIGIVFSTW